MKTIMAVLMLLASASVLASSQNYNSNANTHAYSNASPSPNCNSALVNESCDGDDSVNQPASIPEPGTLSLIGLGLVAIGLVRARKQKV